MSSIGGIGTFNSALSLQSRKLSEGFNRLSSGRRITSGASDPAGLAAAAALDITARRSSSQYRSTNDALSVVNLALGTLGTIGDLDQRRQELALQAANGTFSRGQREALDLEYQALGEERERILQSTEFNGEKLFDGGFSLVSAAGDQSTSFSFQRLTGESQSGSLATPEASRAALDAEASRQQSVQGTLSDLGAAGVRFESVLGALGASADGAATAAARIADADIAEELAKNLSASIQLQAGTALSAQANVAAERGAALLL